MRAEPGFPVDSPPDTVTTSAASSAPPPTPEHARARWVKDGIGATILVVAGVAVLYAARGYGIGTLTAMGAGYFPALLGIALIVIGALMATGVVLAARAVRGAPADARHQRLRDRIRRGVDWRGTGCILGSIVAFVVLGRWGGLLPASFAVVFIAALGDRTNTPFRAASIALVMTGISVVVFWWALQLQMPLLTWIQ